mgnify:CR=1 FL=1
MNILLITTPYECNDNAANRRVPKSLKLGTLWAFRVPSEISVIMILQTRLLHRNLPDNVQLFCFMIYKSLS